MARPTCVDLRVISRGKQLEFSFVFLFLEMMNYIKQNYAFKLKRISYWRRDTGERGREIQHSLVTHAAATFIGK